MSVSALSRLLEEVARSIKHATTMSTILAIELFHARHDAVLASSKVTEILLTHILILSYQEKFMSFKSTKQNLGPSKSN